MQTQATSLCRILKRAEYEPDRDGRAITRADGSPVEYVDLYDAESSAVFRVTVDQGVNGDAAEGAEGYAVLLIRQVQRGRRDGSGYTSTKLRLIGFVPVTAGASPAPEGALEADPATL